MLIRIEKRLIIQNLLAGSPKCGSSQLQCRTSGVCINSQLVCDGYPHCHDRSDEANCSKSLHPANTVVFDSMLSFIFPQSNVIFFNPTTSSTICSGTRKINAALS